MATLPPPRSANKQQKRAAMHSLCHELNHWLLFHHKKFIIEGKIACPMWGTSTQFWPTTNQHALSHDDNYPPNAAPPGHVGQQELHVGPLGHPWVLAGNGCGLVGHWNTAICTNVPKIFGRCAGQLHDTFVQKLLPFGCRRPPHKDF